MHTQSSLHCDRTAIYACSQCMHEDCENSSNRAWAGGHTQIYTHKHTHSIMYENDVLHIAVQFKEHARTNRVFPKYAVRQKRDSGQRLQAFGNSVNLRTTRFAKGRTGSEHPLYQLILPFTRFVLVEYCFCKRPNRVILSADWYCMFLNHKECSKFVSLSHQSLIYQGPVIWKWNLLPTIQKHFIYCKFMQTKFTEILLRKYNG